jgi:hypothetical protein
MVEKEIHAEVEISPAANRRHDWIGGWPGQTGSTNAQIKLLCLRRASQQQKKQAKRRYV